ncbi:MAG: tyrosine--tRNA ligase [Chitinophagales bacterium]|nr:tyrosine--tRNA ligase [Chitinophagales bacterium]
MNFYDELAWRGLIQDTVNETESFMKSKPFAAYIGFDPTAASLHLGNFQQITLLQRLQISGNRPIALMGGATGRVGDPTGKSEERNLLSIDEINHNIACIEKQLSKFIEFGKERNQAVLVNNYDWFSSFSFLDFIRDVGKHITVSYMMSKDSVQNRLESGLSYTEFTYQLIQGYDFYHLHKHYDCHVQLGGSDQWGNITTGVELIRRLSNQKAYALTSPLILRSDGSKFGKSATGENVWLDPKMTSSYKFYQFILNRTDEEAQNLIKRFSFKSKEEILSLIEHHLAEPHLRVLQRNLAEELTIAVHSKEALILAQKASGILFDKNAQVEWNAFDIEFLNEVFEGVPRFPMAKSELDTPIDIVDFLVQKTKIYKSNNEARRFIQDNALKINKNNTTLETKVSKEHIILDKYIWIAQGKKNHYLVELT